MAACDLTIELDDEKRVYSGGEIIAGNIVVQCERDTNCKALEVSTNWATHGRGNIDQGISQTATVFGGLWQAGQEYRYPFQLKSAEWPPTYYGNILNVSHSVRARAKISWAVDPKVEKEFTVATSNSPDDGLPTRAAEKGVGNLIGWIFAAIIFSLFAFFLVWFVPIILLVVGMIWFFKSYLPKQLTGVVTADVQPRRIAPGLPIKCHLDFTPKRNVSINAVTCAIRCVEKCVSGSGSNRKTHTHELFSRIETLADAQRLSAHEKQLFDFDFLIPVSAAPTLKLSDNELLWSVEMRIDIPRWPDWTETIDLNVEPSRVVAGESNIPVEHPPEDAWLHEVLNQLEQSDSRERIEIVLEAIRDHHFSMAIETKGAMDAAPDRSVGERGQWLNGYYEARDMFVALFMPSDAAPVASSRWSGTVKILDFEHDKEVLVVKAMP